MLIDDVT